MAGPRLLVARPVYETVLGILAEAVPGVPVGDPRRPETVVGPMAGEKHLRKVEEFVALARKEGARIVCGGERLDLDGGYYYKPTVIADLANDSRVVQEEIFGPVLTVQPFDSEDEAVAARQLHAVRPGFGHPDHQPGPRTPGRRPAPGGHRLDQRLGDARPRDPLRRRQGLRLRPRVRPRGAGPYTKVKSVVVSLD